MDQRDKFPQSEALENLIRRNAQSNDPESKQLAETVEKERQAAIENDAEESTSQEAFKEREHNGWTYPSIKFKDDNKE